MYQFLSGKITTHVSLNLCIWSACPNRCGLIWNWLRLIEQGPALEYILHSPFHVFLLCCRWRKNSFIYFHLIRCYSVLFLLHYAKPKGIYFYTEWVREEHIDIPNTRCASHAYHMCACEWVQKRELPIICRPHTAGKSLLSPCQFLMCDDCAMTRRDYNFVCCQCPYGIWWMCQTVRCRVLYTEHLFHEVNVGMLCDCVEGSSQNTSGGEWSLLNVPFPGPLLLVEVRSGQIFKPSTPKGLELLKEQTVTCSSEFEFLFEI